MNARRCTVEGCGRLHHARGLCDGHLQRLHRGASLDAPLRVTHPATADRFWKTVDVQGPEDCWIWQGSEMTGGYGRAVIPGRAISAHRAAWYWTYGSLPDAGLQVDHLCRVRLCVNPAHLETVTPQENNLRSSSPSAVNARRTYCGQGHPLTTAPSGQRGCKPCHAAYMRQYNRRKKAA